MSDVKKRLKKITTKCDNIDNILEEKHFINICSTSFKIISKRQFFVKNSGLLTVDSDLNKCPDSCSSLFTLTGHINLTRTNAISIIQPAAQKTTRLFRTSVSFCQKKKKKKTRISLSFFFGIREMFK